MKIEKGKLYYDTIIENLFIAEENNDRASDSISDKIAVHCPTKDDWDYVNKKMNLYWRYNSIHKIRLLNNEDYRLFNNIQEAEQKGYHVITIEKFKEFYPPQIEKKTDDIVKSVIYKYRQRSEVGIKKYGTTLEDNDDGIEIFLTHLQEEMMDATLYIEKLKRQFAELKKHL